MDLTSPAEPAVLLHQRARAHGLRALRENLSVKHRLIGLALLRVSLGLLKLDFYVRHIAQRAFLWGNQGVVPFSTFLNIAEGRRGLSLYLLASRPAVGEAIFWLGVLVTIAFTVGYRTRLSACLFYVFTWSLYSRNPFVLDGGDNLLYLMAFYLIFADCGAHFSVDAAHRAPRRENPFAALVHNFAVYAVIAQLCLLYFTSALYKCQGHMWQDGTAIYYILRAAEFNLSPWAHLFYDHAAVVTLITWSTMVFQMAWPFLIWNRAARPFVAAGALMLHTMIGYFMGLVWFSAVMVSAELMIFDDRDYRRFAAVASGLIARARSGLEAAMPRLRRSLPGNSTLPDQ